MKKKIYILLLGVVIGLTACSDWLDVQPKTSISGDDLFESEAGFKDVLTGFLFENGANKFVCRKFDVWLSGNGFGKL